MPLSERASERRRASQKLLALSEEWGKFRFKGRGPRALCPELKSYFIADTNLHSQGMKGIRRFLITMAML